MASAEPVLSQCVVTQCACVHCWEADALGFCSAGLLLLGFYAALVGPALASLAGRRALSKHSMAGSGTPAARWRKASILACAVYTLL
jgi:hypothetical protein